MITQMDNASETVIYHVQFRAFQKCILRNNNELQANKILNLSLSLKSCDMAAEERRIFTSQTPTNITDQVPKPKPHPLHLLTATSAGQLSQFGSSALSTKRSRKLEKTMIKVMDPNVHQIFADPENINRQSGSEDNFPHKNIPVQSAKLSNHTSKLKFQSRTKSSPQNAFTRSQQKSEKNLSTKSKETVGSRGDPPKMRQNKRESDPVVVNSSRYMVDSDESEIEDEVRQRIKQNDKVDFWRQDEQEYYSGLMPRQACRPLAIMPKGEARTESPPVDRVVKIEQKAVLENQKSKMTLQQKQRHEVLEKLDKKKNFFGPVNPEQVVIQSYSKKRHILLKPELDTGLTAEAMEKLKSQKLRKQRKSMSVRKEKVVSRNQNHHLMALEAPQQSSFVQNKEPDQHNTPLKEIKQVKSLNELVPLSETPYKMHKVDQSFRKGQRAVGSKAQGVLQTIETVVRRKPKDVFRSIQPDRVFERNSRNNSQSKSPKPSPATNYQHKKKFLRVAHESSQQAISGTLQVHRLQGIKQRQISSNSTKELGLNQIVAIPSQPVTHDYSEYRVVSKKHNRQTTPSVQMSEGFQQYALELESRQDSSVGLLRQHHREDRQSNGQIEYPPITAQEYHLPRRQLYREPSDDRSQTDLALHNTNIAQQREQGIVSILPENNPSQQLVHDNSTSKYHQILARRNAQAQGAQVPRENYQSAITYTKQKKSNKNPKRSTRKLIDQTIDHSRSNDPYYENMTLPEVHLPQIQRSRIHSSTPSLSGNQRLNLIALRENRNLKKVKKPKMRLPTLSVQRVVL